MLSRARTIGHHIPKLLTHALWLGSLIALWPASVAHAYCQTAACDGKNTAWQLCTPAQSGDCGTALWWGNQCVGFTLQKDASSQVSLSDAQAVFEAAFAEWSGADCGGGAHPSISVEYQGPVNCDKQEYNTERGNANIIMFRDETWPYSGTANILALTTVTYNKETAEIYDADMEINSANTKGLTIGDSNVEFDLLSIATHEAGHFLGIAHSPIADATMVADYKFGTTSLRDLAQDDIDGICASYPPGQPKSVGCDPEPRHGFSELCGDDQPPPDANQGCCSVAPGTTDQSGGVGLIAAALGFIAAASRKKRKR
ncbi:MAG: matrixin family metalloprotease [Polyangiaceae bacterium]|nr:matrixin family metalloprotease [Polyangiaceae bacterium]